MLQNRLAFDFSAFFKEGAFVDVRIDAIGNDGERGSFFAHSIIMCAASHYFRKILMTQRESGAEPISSVKVQVNPKMFSAFLELAYEGFVLIDPNDEKQFKEALKILNLACLPSSNSSDQLENVGGDVKDPDPAKKKIKNENPMGNKLCLDELPEERLKNLVVCGSGNTKNVFCGICNKVFVRKISAFDHIVSVHTKKRDHKCFFCDEMLPTINLRNIHMSTKHPEEYRAKKLLDL